MLLVLISHAYIKVGSHALLWYFCWGKLIIVSKNDVRTQQKYIVALDTSPKHCSDG